MSRYKPIPSTNYRYEIDVRGNVRNRKTGRILKPFIIGKCRSVSLPLGNGVYRNRSVNSLLSEVYGIEVKPKPWERISVTITKDGESRTFESLRSCADFLTDKVWLSVGTLCRYLSDRKRVIYGWNIIYQGEI